MSKTVVVTAEEAETLVSSGVLWFINRALLHPQGLALAVVYDGDQITGLELIRPEERPDTWSFSEEMNNEGREKLRKFWSKDPRRLDILEDAIDWAKGR